MSRKRKRLARQLDALEETPVRRGERRARAPRRQKVKRGALRAPVGSVVPAALADYGATVRERCGSPARAWLCLSCSQLLANDAQREFHTETGAHMLARVCLTHGAEAPRRKEIHGNGT